MLTAVQFILIRVQYNFQLIFVLTIISCGMQFILTIVRYHLKFIPITAH